MFLAKESQVQDRQQKVQTLIIPLQIVGSATAANLLCTNDEAGFCFLKTGSIDQITAALASSETATYLDAPSDANGIFNVLLSIGEDITKVVGARMVRRDATGVEYAYLGSATGITTGTGGGQKIMITCDSSVALNAANTLKAYLEVHYVTAQ